MSLELDPIELEIAMQTAETIKESDALSNSLNNLDKSVESAKKKFDQQTQALIKSKRTQKKQTQTTKEQTEAQERFNSTMIKTGQNATSSAVKFNALNNSVSQITRELPAFTYSAQTGFMAVSNNIPILIDAMARLRAENEQLRASGQKTTPVWKQVIGSFFSWNTVLSVGLTLITIYGKEIGNFIVSLFKGKESIDKAKISIEAMNEAFNSDSYKQATKDILQLKAKFDAARKGIIDKDKALREYNETVGNTMGQVNSFAEAEKKLINQGDAYVKMMLYKAAALASLDEANKQIIENERKRLNLEEKRQKDLQELKSWGDTPITHGAGVTTFGTTYHNDKANIKSRINSKNKEIQKINEELKQLEKSSLNIYNEIMGKAKKIADKNGFNLFGNETPQTLKNAKNTENEYKKLLEQIAELDKEYNKQNFDKSEAEVQALREKFDKIRKLVEEFNKDPKNKLKIDLEGLNNLETKAVETLIYRQETEQLKKQLVEQKELFGEYEQYKSKVGEAEANRRFSKELKGYKSFSELVRSELEKAQMTNSDAPEVKERIRELQALLVLVEKEQTKTEASKYADLLEEYKGFKQKQIDLENQFNADLNLLENQRNEANASAVDEAIQMRKAKYQEDLSNLQASILQSSDFYQKLFSDLSQKGYKTLRDFAEYTTEVLNSAKTYNTTDGKTMVRIEFDQINEQGEIIKRVSNITIAEFEQIKQKAEELNNVLRNKNPFAAVVESFKQVVKAGKEDKIDDLAQAINNLDISVKNSIATFSDWGESLSTIFGEGVSEAVDNIAKLTTGVIDVGVGIGKLATGDIVGGVTSGLRGISAIFKQVTGWRQKAREQQVKMILADIEALRAIQKQNLVLKENVRELSVYNDKLELRNQLIKEGVIAQDGIQNKFKYDLQMFEEYEQALNKERQTKSKLWSDITSSQFDTGKVSTGSTSYRRFYSVIGADFEEAKLRMQEAAKHFGHEAKEAYEMLNKAGSIENWVKMLDERGWLHGEAKQFYESWKKSGESVAELENKLGSLKDEMRQVVLGENFDGFVNNFANALAQARGNVAQFAEFTQGKIKSSLLNAFKYQFLREQLKPLYENMADLLNQGGDNLDGKQIEQLAAEYNRIYEIANKKLEQMSQKFGVNLYDDSNGQNSPNTLKGAVQGITAEQADLLAGQFGGLRLTQLETNKINKLGFENLYIQTSKMVGIQQDIEKNTRRTADNTAEMKDSLKNIEMAVKYDKKALNGNGINP